jgi:hypothetical protein
MTGIAALTVFLTPPLLAKDHDGGKGRGSVQHAATQAQAQFLRQSPSRVIVPEQRVRSRTPSIAFGGATVATRPINRTEVRYGRPPMDISRGWDRRSVYMWNNHRYHWYGNSWVILNSGYDVPYTTYYPSAPMVAANDDLVSDVQAALGRRGYNVGVVDGDLGPQTQDAIAAFQSDRGLRVTGRIDQPLLRALGID